MVPCSIGLAIVQLIFKLSVFLILGLIQLAGILLIENDVSLGVSDYIKCITCDGVKHWVPSFGGMAASENSERGVEFRIFKDPILAVIR